MASTDAPQVPSVGRALELGQSFSTSHPFYRSITDEIFNKTRELSARKGLARASARPAAITVALQTHELQELAVAFPEFTFVNYGSARPGHASWVQFRRLANDWLMLQASKYGTTVAHLGGSVLSYLFSAFSDAVMLCDTSSAAAAHERHAVSLDTYKLFRDYGVVQEQMEAPEARAKYEAYLSKAKFRSHSVSQGVPEVDVLCVDCSMHPYSPLQVASMMMQSGASITFGCFVYNPYMLLQDEGEIPGTGVFFSKTSSGLALKYPEGQAGVLRYPRGVWESWLASQVFPVGKGDKAKWFQLELLRDRGHLMFFRITALPQQPSISRVHHALEIHDADDKYLINSWTLSKLGADPGNPHNWVPVPYVASKRLVDRVYQFAMQVDKVNFTRYAIRKQLHVVNDRVTVEGTSVVVNSPLGVRLVDSLVVAIYARAFVDRYESGQLTKEMMEAVGAVAAFRSMTWAARAWFVARVSIMSAWDYTFGYVNGAIRRMADWVRDAVARAPNLPVPEVMDVPPYLLLSQVAVNWIGSIGGRDLVDRSRQMLYDASVSHTGFCSTWTEAFSYFGKVSTSAVPLWMHRFRIQDAGLYDTKVGMTEDARSFVSQVSALNPVAEDSDDRYASEVATAVRQVRHGVVPEFSPDPDPVYTMNEFYRKVCPGVPLQRLEYDSASVSLDPQDRTLAAPYLRLPSYFGEAPRPRLLYHSNLHALNVPKRQGTLQELLSSMAARNLNAPQISLPQDEESMIRDVWANFLDTACVPGAREMCDAFQRKPVDLTEASLLEWAGQATPDKLRMARAELEDESRALGEMDVGEYLAMLKSDVKPTLSTKPLDARTEPQVIVYHKKALSALYSSMFRMLVRRFLLLLRPNYHVNLLKDTDDIEQFLRSVHPFGSSVKYLENDFSKYDKSQGRFVFKLEEYVFRQLGLNEEMLAHWVQGHVECNIRSVALGLSLHVMYQRKSGDATTAFGNVVLNILSVSYAYKGTQVVWAIFMGDDSLVCAAQVACADTAVATLAEVFNLGAKTYQTDAPYFASNFVLIDDVNEDVVLVPDPVKRIERWSMMVSADDPQWEERFVSAADSMRSYRVGFSSQALARAVSLRYPISFEEVGDVASAVATVVADREKFRAMWSEKPEVSLY